ncbi:hypothetical protein GBL_0829 [Geobacillus kaustophilus GBlys]|uniref:Uncharacterized protein n=1 Tax=Geobacillus kaustophilus GBlys TaxID=1337888 RepID=U2X2A6_GEOKU|nr:hypothetical protein GBL_0829 [Geobacillus kaustophilus GBlys]
MTEDRTTTRLKTHEWVFKQCCSVTRQSDEMIGKNEKC